MSDEQEFLSIDELMAKVSLSRSTIHRLAMEDPTFPDRLKLGQSVRFRAADVERWLQDREDAGRWEGYRALVPKSALAGALNGVMAKARKLGLIPEEVELHQLVLREHARVSKLADDLAGAQAEMGKAHQRPADTGLGLDVKRSELQRDAVVRLSKARHAAQQLAALESCFARLFGLDPAVQRPTRAAWNSLPPAVRERLAEIEEAKRMAETEPDEEMNKVL